MAKQPMNDEDQAETLNPAAAAKQQAHNDHYQLANSVGRSAIAVIDALSSRGAFKGEELLTIGQLREQCVKMIQQAETYFSDNN